MLAQFRAWERPAQLALIIALALIVVVLALGRIGPEEVREPALIGLFGLLISVQVIVLWAKRGLVKPYTAAQRHYLAGNFEAASAVLEQLRQAGKADFRALTLLGNTYRQQGALAESAAVLQEALSLQPNHHFPLYGFGRTLLVMGRFAEAARAFEAALEAGGSPIGRLDAAEAYFRMGAEETARSYLAGAETADEPHRRLMQVYLLHQLGVDEPPDAPLIQAGIPYWEASAARFAGTPYGDILAADVRWLQARLKEM
ncbi:MAG: tetratricopeptide repeat protein [Aggregatilineales bacterium]